MNTLNIKPTKSTPEVIFDIDEGTFRMSGVCVPEDGPAFFGPIIDTIEDSIPVLQVRTSFSFDLKYFNSSSLKGIYCILKQIDSANQAGKKISIEWIVEKNDEFMTDSASTFKDLVDTPIVIRKAA